MINVCVHFVSLHDLRWPRVLINRRRRAQGKEAARSGEDCRAHQPGPRGRQRFRNDQPSGLAGRLGRVGPGEAGASAGTTATPTAPGTRTCRGGGRRDRHESGRAVTENPGREQQGTAADQADCGHHQCGRRGRRQHEQQHRDHGSNRGRTGGYRGGHLVRSGEGLVAGNRGRRMHAQPAGAAQRTRETAARHHRRRDSQQQQHGDQRKDQAQRRGHAADGNRPPSQPAHRRTCRFPPIYVVWGVRT